MIKLPLASQPIGVDINAAGRLLSIRQFPPAGSLSSVLCVSRGGGEIDLDRSNLRLDAIGAYPVVAALLLSALWGMNTGTPKVIKTIPDDADRSTVIQIKIENVLTCIFSLISMMSIASSAYSVGIFSLVVIYSKSALGLGLDDSFVKFVSASADLRSSAFHSTYFSMVGFIISLSLSTFLKGEGIIRWLESVPTFLISILTFVRYKEIVNLATALIYS